MTGNRILFLRIEPASYVLALLGALREIWPGEIEAQFITANESQPWEFDVKGIGASLLPSSAKRARKVIKEIILNDPRPDLVHTAGWGASACRAAISCAHKSGVPVVVDHDTWSDAATGVALLAKRVILPRRFEKISHFAAGGKRQVAFVRRYGVPEDKITAVNMTVDVNKIRRYLSNNTDARNTFRRKFGLPEGAMVLLSLSRLVPGKGIEDLLDSWSSLAQAHADIHLVIAGDGPLMPLVRAAVGERVHILGRLSGEDVWDAYAGADLFVAPSRQEPWGLTINEAMAAGLPIVMTDAFGCVGDLAFADETACIARAGDPAHLHACLEKALVSEKFRMRLKENASKVISGWTISDQARRITDVWARVLG